MPLSPYFAGQLLAFARACVNEHKRRLSVQYPPASVPGEYPARRTGNLRRSTVARPKSVATIQSTGVIRIGYLDRAFYGVILETKMRRLSFADTVADVIQTRVKGGRLPKGVTWRSDGETLW